MSNIIILNSFQTPNSYVDSAMAMLTPEEYKCLSFATRHILGWQDKINKRRGFISLSMFEHGFISAKGVVFGGTGLGRPTIIRATDELTRLLFLIKIGEPTAEGQEWELGDTPDFEALVTRYKARKTESQLRTAKARDARRTGGMSDKPAAAGMSDKPVVVSGTNQQRLVGQTSAGMSDKLNQIHSQNHLQNPSQIKLFSSNAKPSIQEPKPPITNGTVDDLKAMQDGIKPPEPVLSAATVAPDKAKHWAVAYSQLGIQLDRASFETWVRDTQLVAVDGNVWRFAARTQYAADMLQHRLIREISRVLSDVVGVDRKQLELCFETAVQA